jgi:hypothetical protein
MIPSGVFVWREHRSQRFGKVRIVANVMTTATLMKPFSPFREVPVIDGRIDRDCGQEPPRIRPSG